MLPPFAAKISEGPLEPAQLMPVVVFAGLYAYRVRKLALQGRPVPGWRQACFHGGLVVILIAQISPVSHVSQQLLCIHMVEHLLMGDIASLMLVLGLTAQVIAPILRIKVFDRLRVLSNPIVAFPLWTIDLYAWHSPLLYQAALRHSGIHFCEHACFVGFGMNMWMCLFGPLPQPEWFGNAAKLGYIIAVRLSGAILGNIFLWSGTVFYPYYRAGDAYWHISPVADQSIAGAEMMIEGSILTIILFGWLFMRTAREIEAKQVLMDYAREHGIELADRRAARAVSAGRGDELMRRLQSAATGDARVLEGERAAPVAAVRGDPG
ncbi:MAG TPA: cytochrome c oxidase assembly protein [Solirubrobacteraceae bacterium]|nr:cytochrome c oxidase assembly protein [Solirubrobacteraceae bacterium]